MADFNAKCDEHAATHLERRDEGGLSLTRLARQGRPPMSERLHVPAQDSDSAAKAVAAGLASHPGHGYRLV